MDDRYSIDKPKREIDNFLAYRETERYIYKVFGKKPLSASFDKLGNNSTAAISHVRKWIQNFDFQLCPTNNEASYHKRIIEVYPALLKGAEFSGVLNRMKEKIPTSICDSSDAFDAARMK